MPAFGITGFKGPYPVGTSGVVVAGNEQNAFKLLCEELAKGDTANLNKDLTIEEVNIQEVNRGEVIILQDGSY